MKKQIKDEVQKQFCNGECKKNKPLTDYYNSKSPMFNGKITVCKACLKSMIDYSNMQTVYTILQQMDIMFDIFYWNRALESKTDTFARYITMANSFHQFEGLSWKDSRFQIVSADEEKLQTKDIFSQPPASDSLINKWGDGYTPEEYQSFEKKWTKLIDNYGEKTSLHTEGLITYIRFRTKEEMATAKNNTKDAKDWAALAKEAATAAKLNVSQLSKSDISGGVDLMSQLYEAVETEVGIIPLLPKLLEQPYDDADMIIWSIVNYTRRLEDKPPVPYREVWNFYDDMLGEHFTQQNYNKDQIKQFKEKRINIFRDLSEIYKEPLYESED